MVESSERNRSVRETTVVVNAYTQDGRRVKGGLYHDATGAMSVIDLDSIREGETYFLKFNHELLPVEASSF